MPFYNHHPRLAEQYYIGQRATFVTICCAERRPVFTDVALGQWALSELLPAAARHAFFLHAYCLMPDHLHVVACGKRPDSNLLRFIHNFKQTTAYTYQQRCGRQLWQPRFYDHILRSADALASVAAYVWMNPLRKSLCIELSAYPLSGSQTMPWMNFLPPNPPWLPPWRIAKKSLCRHLV